MKIKVYPFRLPAFMLLMFTLLSITAKAQFSGYYDPSVWIFTEDPTGTGGSIDPSSAPASISLTSGNSNIEGNSDFYITMPANGTVTFDWNYSTIDGAAYDYPLYVIDGVETMLSGYSTSGGQIQSGTASISVLGGQTFALRMHTEDGAYGPGTTVFSNFTAPAASACGSTVAGGSAVSNLTSICPGQNANLSITGATAGLGITVQWEESPTGTGSFTTIPGATAFSYVVSGSGISSSMDYHAIITCSNGGASATSSDVTVDLNPATLCYCSPLTGTTLHTYSYNYINNVTVLGTTLNSSNPVEGPGGYLLLSSSIPSNTATFTQGVTYNMTNTMDYSGLTSEVWIDYDQSGTFDASEFVGLSPASGSGNISSGVFTIPYTATPGMTGMRVRANYFSFADNEACYDPYYDGETEDYIVTIDAALPCGGTPVGGTASGPVGVCASSPFTISDLGATTGLGIDMQWEESPVGAGSWTDVVGATNSYYINPGITSSTDYRLRITCSNGGGVDYSNVITVSLNPFYLCYCSPLTGTTLHTYSYNYLNNVTITGTSLNSSNPTVGAGGYLQLDPSIASNTATLTQGVTYNMENTMDGSGLTSEVWIDYDQNGVFDASEFISLSAASGANNLSTGIFTIPYTATPGLTGMRVRANYNPFSAGDACYDPYYDGETEDYVITIDAALPCGGTPVAGTANGPSSICPSSPFTLFASGTTTGLGIELQWQESPTGTGSWTDITGATTGYFSNPGITAGTDFRLMITCTNGGGVDYSNELTVLMNPFSMCYCSPLTGVTLHTYSYNYVNNVTIPGTTLNSSNPVEGPGGYLQLDPNIASNTATLTQGVTYTMTNTMTYSGLTSEVWIDYNQDGVFDASEFVGLDPASGPNNISSGNIMVPITALTGQTGMRVRANYYSFGSGDACYDPYYDGETEDYVITIDAALPCGGTPVGGTASGPSGICPSTAFSLSLTGYTTGLGITIQWQESPAGAGTWSDISGATNPFYNNGGISTAMDYQVLITCANGGGTATSNIVSVSVNSFASCYCMTNLGGYTGNSIDNIEIVGTTLNNSTPGTAPGYYTAYPATGNTTGTLILGQTYTLNYTFDVPSMGSVWIDFDQSGTFDPGEWTQLTINGASGNVSINVPVTALPGLTGMRVRSRGLGNTNGPTDPCTLFGSGETEDYIVTLDAGTPCVGAPAAGSVNGPSGACLATNFTLSLSGFTIGSGITFQWQSSPAGLGTFANIAGATNPSYTTTQTSATDYQAIVTCTNGTPSSATSNVLTVIMNPVTMCYCIPTYANGGTADYIANVTLETLNNTSSGNPSPYYVDYTGQQPVTIAIPDLVPGASYNMSLTFGTDFNQYNGIWIDFNQDGVFDVTEFMTSGTNNNSGGATPTVVAISIPAGATLGQTRMRIRGADDVQPNDNQSCGASNSTYGETEDYLVNITNTPLAIGLKNISAANVGQRNRVDWTTATEDKGDYFIVERSADGRNFSSIGDVTAKGQASGYSFWDQTPVAGVNYYRLKLMNASGSFSYSKVVTATVKSTSGFVVEAYPNPVTDQVTVTAYGQQGANANISICDVTGKVLRVIDVTGASAKISMSSMASGLYLIKYSDSNHTQTIKVNKQ